jgi:hypothetical protein
LQEVQGGALLQFGKQRERYGIIGFEAGGQLVHQARLHLDQAVLVARERFEFGHQRTIRLQAPQIGELRPAVFGEQIGIDLIGFGARCTPLAIHRLGVDGIDRTAGGQQSRNQQAMGGFDDAGQFLSPLGSADGEQKVREFSQSCGCVHHASRAYLTPVRINDDHIMVVVCPIDASKPHKQTLLAARYLFLNQRVLLLRRSQRDSLMSAFPGTAEDEGRSFEIGRAVWKEEPFAFRAQ